MGTSTTTPSHRVIARSREVTSYHRDDEKPGKPLYLLIPGGAIAGGACIGMAIYGYSGWVSKSILPGEAIRWIAMLLVPYFGGLLMFSYGYELYDWPKAIKLALIAGLVGLAVLLILVAIAAALAALSRGSAKGGGSKSSSKRSSRGSFKASSGGSWFSIHTPDSLFGSGTEGSTPGPNTLATCPTCGQPLPSIDAPCPNCLAKSNPTA